MVFFGPGRLGRSLQHYFWAFGHGCELVDRQMTMAERDRVAGKIRDAAVVAAALPDDSIAPWYAAWKGVIADRPAIHFSGTVKVPGMFAYHPLYSFSGAFVHPDVMRTVVFVRERGDPPLSTMVPGLKNPEIEIDGEDRAYYHALAVLGGNFPAFLWNVTAAAFRERFPNLPADALATYFASLVERFREDPINSYTGPVARRDRGTVEANLAALKEDPKLDSLYRTFLASAWPEWPEKGRK
jgi:hypothetical protein